MRKSLLEKSYDNEWEKSRNKKQASCEHKHWIKMCSHCRFIMDSDALHEQTKQKEIKL